MNQNSVNRKWNSLFKKQKSFVDEEAEIDVLKQRKRAYYKQVWEITESQPLHTLKNIEKRGKDWHLDHIHPIAKAYKEGLDPCYVGHISNLQMLTHKENFAKGARVL